MIEINDCELRNMPEQVAKNQCDIEALQESKQDALTSSNAGTNVTITKVDGVTKINASGEFSGVTSLGGKTGNITLGTGLSMTGSTLSATADTIIETIVSDDLPLAIDPNKFYIVNNEQGLPNFNLVGSDYNTWYILCLGGISSGSMQLQGLANLFYYTTIEYGVGEGNIAVASGVGSTSLSYYQTEGTMTNACLIKVSGDLQHYVKLEVFTAYNT